jgi:hypothetical protein
MFKLEIISRLLNQQRSFTPLHRHEPKESLHGCFKQWRKFNERQGITNLPCDLKAGEPMVSKGVPNRKSPKPPFLAFKINFSV